MAIQKEDLVAPATSLISRTTKDMEAMWKWKKGETVDGTFAESAPGWKRYREDIDNAPNQRDYDKKTNYINTIKPIGKQLEDVKK